jgi:dTDP-4-amino-4,6-dideoxygalactose transaminase
VSFRRPPGDRIYLSPPDVGDLERGRLLAALDSGWIAPLGPDVDGFEADMAQRVGVAEAVALSSGTAALHLGLLGLGVRPGDVVICATLTFAATANAVHYVGAQPWFVDVDPLSGNMDPGLLREAIEAARDQGSRVAAVIPVDLFGKVADYTSIESIAAESGISVLADAAESVGATSQGRAAGSFGAASVFSFNGNKVMTTSGGGMLLTDDAALASRTRYLATQARQPVVHYEHTEIGYNYRLSNLLAALGRAQLERLDAMIARRREIRARYADLLREVPGVRLFGVDDDDGDNAWLTSILVDADDAGWTPDALRAALEADNIESRPLWKPMHLQPVFTTAPATITGTAQRLFEQGLTLPSGSALTDEDIDRVHACIRLFLGGI